MPAAGWKRGESIAGREYGLWRVLAETQKRDEKRKNRFWLCVCACGTFRIVATHAITRAAKKPRPGGCGCNVTIHGFPQKRIPSTDPRIFAFRRAFYARRARLKLKLPFELSVEVFAELSQQNCHYCGAPPSMPTRYDRAQPADPMSNGIDRVDNARGYVTGNVVACCPACNAMKLDRSAAEFIAQAKRIAAYNA